MAHVVERSEAIEIDPRPADEIDPLHWALIGWRYRWLILFVTLACGTAAFIRGWTAPPSYESTAKLIAVPGKTGLGDAVVTVNMPAIRTLLDNQAMAEVVVREFGLQAEPFRLTPQDFLRTVLTTESVTATNILVLRVRLPRSDLPPKVVNRFAQLSVSLAERVRQEDTSRAREDMKVELEHARERFQTADERYTRFRKEAQIETLRQDIDAQLKQRGELLPLVVEIQAEKARLTKVEEELARHEPTRYVRRTIDNDPTLMEAARATSKSPAELLGLSVRNEYVNAVYDELDKQVAESRAKLSGLERKKAELAESLKVGAAQLPSLNLLYARQSELALLEGERDLAKEVYVAVASRYQKIRLQVIGTSAELQVLDPAPAAASLLPSKLLRDTMIGLILGFAASLVLGIFAGVLRDATRAPAADD
jgi:uncharacterized protein involved in exopolysaccharide biosynthesis